MKNILNALFIVFLCFGLSFSVSAEKQPEPAQSKTARVKASAAGCLPGAGFKYLDINNVRCRINTGGDMWWDFDIPQYEIPAGSKKTSMFSASLWVGGVDVNDQLKLAALRYRQGPSFGGGNDFWPGPLTIDGTAAVSEQVCAEYDKLFPMKREWIDEFLAWWDDKESYPDYVIPAEILNWPAHGDVSKGQSYYLAPFYDLDGDGEYNPIMGDYPYYDISNELCPLNFAGIPEWRPTPTAEADFYFGGQQDAWKYGILADQVIKGDETLWWVFNDKGNIHTETYGDPIGFEIRAQAFGFSTNDEINNMTFYSYEIINRSTYRLTDTYFSQWVDTDLGYAKDDYVGCDIMRGLGYCYNGKPEDGSGQYNAYGSQPPAIGVDFFQGPYMDADGYDNPAYVNALDSVLGPSYGGKCDIVNQDGTIQLMQYYKDKTKSELISDFFLVRAEAINGVNFGNGIVDDERFGMRRFVYHNNSGSGVPSYMTDPNYAPEYYNFLRGIWKDNTKMRYGGNAHESSNAYGPDCDFMFPGTSDVCDWGTGGIPPAGPKNWTEETAGNPPEDRRFMQSAGPFTLEPGQVNYITVGIPWAKANTGGPWASVELLRVVDDKCQALFDNCFSVIQGPNAPDLTFRELENEFIVYITNRKTNDLGSNFNESYREIDPSIEATNRAQGTDYDPYYTFQGYQIYQLANSEASIADITDPNLARLVYQCDVKDNVTQLVNHNYDQSLGASVPVEMVNGNDQGIQHTFRLKEDAFTGEAFVNHEKYYFLAVAYGYNEYMKYSADPAMQEPGIVGLEGQKAPYLAGRKNIRVYTAIPHRNIGGIVPKAQYGDQPSIVRIQGQGNGRNILEYTKEVVAAMGDLPPIDTIWSYGEDTTWRLASFEDENYPLMRRPVFKANNGPINVKVIDPLNVKNAEFELRFDSIYWFVKNNITGDVALPAGEDTLGFGVTTWSLYDITNNKVYKADTTIAVDNEQLFLELGISVNIQQCNYPGNFKVGAIPDGTSTINVYHIPESQNGVLHSDIYYADSSRQWLSGVSDIDESGPWNWIRSGTTADPENQSNNDWDVTITSNGTAEGNPYWDPEGAFEGVIDGTWAPYFMCATGEQDPAGPAQSRLSKSLMKNMSRVHSIDVVFTSDKSKWTRCPVIEMSNDVQLAQGGAKRFTIRAAQSVDKDGNPAPVGSGPSSNPDDPNYISETGMGWFPGYVYDLETGERLNIIFGEDSWLVGENGRDMLFNPTSNMYNPLINPANPDPSHVLFGGKHYVYVFGHTEKLFGPNPSAQYDSPPYDAGAWLRNSIKGGNLDSRIWASAMWVGLPMAHPIREWMSNDARVAIRVARPYQRYYSTMMYQDSTSQDVYNRNFPVYSFSTEALATQKGVIEIAQTELELINVVPNPYYAYSTYEVNQLDNRIKIVNLPRKCTVSIYNVSGTLVRQFTKDEDITSIDWNLKNSAGIPIAGGIYLIHVDAPGIGERTIKWFGSLRPIDLNAF
ncbi:MAG: T9SS type A sorting domain-containing protein [Bacteroidales bacterium]|nr:T9SS type A sorting domain-containing protein [Bacteroidales bacterium]